MRTSILPYIASPVSHRPIAFADGKLRTADGAEEFAIADGVPILLPPGQVADSYNEILEIVFGPQSAEVTAEADAAATSEQRSAVIRAAISQLGKQGVREAFRAYGRLPHQERLSNYVRLPPNRQSDGFPMIPRDALESARQYASLEGGRARAAQMAESESAWAVHLAAYGASVLEESPGIIAELGAGAGMGTWAVLRRGLGPSLLISLDLDFACVGNAEGLARACGVEDRVSPIVANFWFLPFRDGRIDTVCAHYGLDESREVPRALGEVARVLTRGGRFVVVFRRDASVRIGEALDFMGFQKDELRAMAAEARLCAGSEQLTRDAAAAGLLLDRQETFSTTSSHARVLLVFRKA